MASTTNGEGGYHFHDDDGGDDNRKRTNGSPEVSSLFGDATTPVSLLSQDSDVVLNSVRENEHSRKMSRTPRGEVELGENKSRFPKTTQSNGHHHGDGRMAQNASTEMNDNDDKTQPFPLREYLYPKFQAEDLVEGPRGRAHAEETAPKHPHPSPFSSWVPSSTPTAADSSNEELFPTPSFTSPQSLEDCSLLFSPSNSNDVDSPPVLRNQHGIYDQLFADTPDEQKTKDGNEEKSRDGDTSYTGSYRMDDDDRQLIPSEDGASLLDLQFASEEDDGRKESDMRFYYQRKYQEKLEKMQRHFQQVSWEVVQPFRQKIGDMEDEVKRLQQEQEEQIARDENKESEKNTRLSKLEEELHREKQQTINLHQQKLDYQTQLSRLEQEKELLKNRLKLQGTSSSRPNSRSNSALSSPVRKPLVEDTRLDRTNDDTQQARSFPRDGTKSAQVLDTFSPLAPINSMSPNVTTTKSLETEDDEIKNQLPPWERELDELLENSKTGVASLDLPSPKRGKPSRSGSINSEDQNDMTPKSIIFAGPENAEKRADSRHADHSMTKTTPPSRAPRSKKQSRGATKADRKIRQQSLLIQQLEEELYETQQQLKKSEEEIGTLRGQLSLTQQSGGSEDKGSASEDQLEKDKKMLFDTTELEEIRNQNVLLQKELAGCRLQLEEKQYQLMASQNRATAASPERESSKSRELEVGNFSNAVPPPESTAEQVGVSPDEVGSSGALGNDELERLKNENDLLYQQVHDLEGVAAELEEDLQKYKSQQGTSHENDIVVKLQDQVELLQRQLHSWEESQDHYTKWLHEQLLINRQKSGCRTTQPTTPPSISDAPGSITSLLTAVSTNTDPTVAETDSTPEADLEGIALDEVPMIEGLRRLQEAMEGKSGCGEAGCCPALSYLESMEELIDVENMEEEADSFDNDFHDATGGNTPHKTAPLPDQSQVDTADDIDSLYILEQILQEDMPQSDAIVPAFHPEEAPELMEDPTEENNLQLATLETDEQRSDDIPDDFANDDIAARELLGPVFHAGDYGADEVELDMALRHVFVQLYKRVQQLEQERSEMILECLNMVKSACAAQEAEFDAMKALLEFDAEQEGGLKAQDTSYDIL